MMPSTQELRDLQPYRLVPRMGPHRWSARELELEIRRYWHRHKLKYLDRPSHTL